MDFQQSKTKENLARSFASECMEGARYQFLAKMAQQQGYEYLSNLVRTIAHNEMAHAQQFLNKKQFDNESDELFDSIADLKYATKKTYKNINLSELNTTELS